MSFSQWLRRNSEDYLLRDAHTRLSKAYGRPAPPPESRGLRHLFWARIFVPTYRVMPWPMRHWILRQIPGSHRKHWTTPPQRHTPAV